MPKLPRTIAAAALALCAALPARAADDVSLRLNTLLNGWHCPWHMAVQRGWFAEQGINVREIGEGRGSGDTAQLVSAGTDTFGLVDPSVAMSGIVRGLPLKAVFSLMNKTTLAVVTAADKPIHAAADLRGKSFASPGPGSSAAQLFTAVLARNKIDAGDVRVVSVDPAAQPTILMAGQVDGILTGLDGLPDLLARGFKATYVNYADLGVNTPVSSVITSTTTLENADLVRRFVAVTERAWIEAQAHPEAVVEACQKVKPSIAAATYRAQLDIVLQVLFSDATRGHPIGWGAESDWQSALDIQKQYRDLKTDLPAAAFFTNEFIPQ